MLSLLINSSMLQWGKMTYSIAKKTRLLYLDFVHNLYDCLSTRKYTHLFITIEA